ncbi:hypothetical protein Y1Q_0014904 [Alligator mississippiensis]|uniref:Uncharacterized protein n=1 Tax=Alligator mississippiensis TaxID=8496 RepID=A0A151N8E9_ALLMI|nr:hypothetical protein Y1Q_0014904 [Alligator mississippiensis]
MPKLRKEVWTSNRSAGLLKKGHLTLLYLRNLRNYRSGWSCSSENENVEEKQREPDTARSVVSPSAQTLSSTDQYSRVGVSQRN